MNEEHKMAWKTFTEEIEVAGHQLLGEINRLVSEGNVRKLRILSKEGEVVVNIPLTAGAVAGGVVVVAAPWIAVIATLAAVVAKVRLEVVRSVPADEEARDGAGVHEASAPNVDDVPPPAGGSDDRPYGV